MNEPSTQRTKWPKKHLGENSLFFFIQIAFLVVTFEPEMLEIGPRALKTQIIALFTIKTFRVKKLALGMSAHGPVTSAKKA